MSRNLGIVPEEDKPFYFISYNSEDEVRVKEYVVALNKMDIPLWYDEGIVVGDKWKRTIAARIDDCEEVIMFLSRNIFKKKESYVYKEFEMATGYSNKRVIVVMLDKIEKTEVPVRYRDWWIDINEMQCVNAFEYDTEENCAKAIAKEIGNSKSIIFSDVIPVEVIEYENGDKYEGPLLNGKKNGKGKYIWAKGAVYEGEYLDGKRTGKGRYVWANGDVYEGDFIDGHLTGKGKLTWADGDAYEGDFIDGQPNGKGKLTWTDGDAYEGDFADGRRTGKGKLTWANGNVYEGDYIDGQRIGKGKLTMTNGDVYEGEFTDGQPTGKGTLTQANGVVKNGIWEKGNLVSEF